MSTNLAFRYRVHRLCVNINIFYTQRINIRLMCIEKSILYTYSRHNVNKTQFFIHEPLAPLRSTEFPNLPHPPRIPPKNNIFSTQFILQLHNNGQSRCYLGLGICQPKRAQTSGDCFWHSYRIRYPFASVSASENHLMKWKPRGTNPRL